MGLLTFDKSVKDIKRWRATYKRKGGAHLEIRGWTPPMTQILIIVAGSEGRDHLDRDGQLEPHGVRLSANGAMAFTPKTWEELQQVIKEAHKALRETGH